MSSSDSPPHVHPPTRAATDEAPHASSHGISFKVPDHASPSRPLPKKQMSTPVYPRHHKRIPSRPGHVKETLDARSHYGSSDDDGTAVHRINQYIIKQEIGRGSFGAVHQAVDQYGNEYAVKEFSKSRLRKRAQSNLLRNPNRARKPGHLAAGLGFNSPLHRQSSSDKLNRVDTNDSLSLIKEEIAIMKKLNHNNLVSLIEVLDDPQEDSLYMVMEMCKKGVVMKVGLDDRAEPYEDEACRCWFRDMILGVEYLHAQGVVHRDIKPDNCLITDDDVLKIVDFGVSEMFEKESEMATTKSAGSPAFMPPELCVAKHGQVSGRAADIWSMGVTLYCLRYGHIPFEQTSIFELYDSIRGDELDLNNEKDEHFEDLIRRLLEKDAEKRITMDEIRVHPWVTKNGQDPLLSAEDNCADLVEPPTEIEMNHAITSNVGHLMTVMKAVQRFKKLVLAKRPHVREGIFGRDFRMVAPPGSISDPGRITKTHAKAATNKQLAPVNDRMDVDEDDLRRSLDKMIVQNPTTATPADQLDEDETIAQFHQKPDSSHRSFTTDPTEHKIKPTSRARTFDVDEHAAGHAHDPLTETLFLDIGAGPDEARQGSDSPHPIVSESPPGIDIDIYEQAYQDEMKRIMEKRQGPSLYLNRRVDHRHDIKGHGSVLDASKDAVVGAAEKLSMLAGKGAIGLGSATGGGVSGFAALVKEAQAKNTEAKGETEQSESATPGIDQAAGAANE
ncbi:calcium/calmodulin-dependent protein kinase kinase cmkC-like protein [Acrodontium crateriforme]|uniref:Calcium/calmodulin-dependent protein kinase kinase cmkC-like protein n=1 Tax=Acrodontium crateriforme TaxID=150365 RepID=A0AAQ3M3Y5_9PEZI|nr:calcium/calmodulin-dependent protein kinase kinase cmkC-like protein [Acrodontium crateriforme]